MAEGGASEEGIWVWDVAFSDMEQHLLDIPVEVQVGLPVIAEETSEKDGDCVLRGFAACRLCHECVVQSVDAPVGDMELCQDSVDMMFLVPPHFME